MGRPIAESGAIQETRRLIWEIGLIHVWDITDPSARKCECGGWRWGLIPALSDFIQHQHTTCPKSRYITGVTSYLYSSQMFSLVS